METFKNILISFRFHHWIKNLLVFSVLVFSGNLTNLPLLYTTIIVFTIFCFISSGIYILNDILDIKSDRLHPIKKTRPIASGRLKKRLSLITCIILLVLFSGLSFYMDINLGYIMIAYIVLNILYSLFIKNIVILDVFFLAIGFFLRVLAGGVVIGIMPSYWLILFIFFLSMFFGFSKRYYEVTSRTDIKNKYQSKQFLRISIFIFATISIIIYTLYSISFRTVEIYGDIRLLFSLPFVLFGIIRYMYVNIFTDNASDPVTIFYKDKFSIINLGIWFVCIIYLIYLY